nr:helix-turn-helix domain-containing protein [Zobellia alginiliquefaciens]
MPLHIMADRYPKLIIQHMHGDSGIMRDNKTTVPHAYVSGIITHPLSYQIREQYAHLGVCFYPDALPQIFKISAENFTDTCLSLSELIPPCSYLKLIEAKTIQQKIQILSSFFCERVLDRSSLKPSAVVKKILYPSEQIDNFAVKSTALEQNVSERTLERKFKFAVGVSPKKYLQLQRFERTYQNLSTKNITSMAQIGYQNGFADHSHFIRDFKRHAGMLPTAFVKNVHDEREYNNLLIWNYTND